MLGLAVAVDDEGTVLVVSGALEFEETEELAAILDVATADDVVAGRRLFEDGAAVELAEL